MTRPADRALARLTRQMDAAAAPTPDEVAAIESRARVRVMAKLKRAAGRPLTTAEAEALDTDAADTAAYMAHLRATGRPTDPDHFARQKANLTAHLVALRDHHREEPPP